jgi:hypothetical protein
MNPMSSSKARKLACPFNRGQPCLGDECVAWTHHADRPDLVRIDMPKHILAEIAAEALPGRDVIARRWIAEEIAARPGHTVYLNRLRDESEAHLRADMIARAMAAGFKNSVPLAPLHLVPPGKGPTGFCRPLAPTDRAYSTWMHGDGGEG